jgi:glycine/D-amino acid oxidase-like deaminating enzyme
MVEDLATRSYWLSLDPYEPNPPLEGDVETDVAIVGGGFTGLWTAYHLLKADPGMTVAILDANAIGYGASGRNGGFAMTLIHRSLAGLVYAVGPEHAKALHHAAEQSVRGIERVCAEEGIQADLQPNGLITVSNNPLQDNVIRRDVETAQRLGIGGITYLDRHAVQSAVHSETFRCGMREATCTLLNPARLARGLKRVVERLGARIYEDTPMTCLAPSDRDVAVVTPRGRVVAQRVVLAANAYSSRIPHLRRYVMPFYSYILLSEPLTAEQWARVGWAGREGMEDRRVFLHYFRPTIDGRLLWAGRDAPYHPDGPHPRYDRDDHVFRRLEETFAWTFPQLHDVRFEYRWGGPIGVTGEFLPLVGWLKGERIAYAFGYNGHGVAITHLASRAIRDLILDRDSDERRLAIVNRKPVDLGPALLRDPLVRATVKYQLRRDDEGRELPPPLLARLMQRLASAARPQQE